MVGKKSKNGKLVKFKKIKLHFSQKQLGWYDG